MRGDRYVLVPAASLVYTASRRLRGGVEYRNQQRHAAASCAEPRRGTTSAVAIMGGFRRFAKARHRQAHRVDRSQVPKACSAGSTRSASRSTDSAPPSRPRRSRKVGIKGPIVYRKSVHEPIRTSIKPLDTVI